MIRIYVNDRRIFICSNEEKSEDADIYLRLTGEEMKEELSGIITAFEENTLTKTLTFQTPHVDKTFNTIKNIYTIMEAAGGLVFNSSGQLLMIYRNDRWDLPKGKIEKDERSDNAAMREVEEECGVSQLSITKQGLTTYHTYPYKEKRILKCTYWYHMICNDATPPQPQHEEGISEAKWMDRNELRSAMAQSYASVIYLLTEEKILNVF
jgi:8-oxo-dGTP pyrophosphatase MutT (NUDIX family)